MNPFRQLLKSSGFTAVSVLTLATLVSRTEAAESRARGGQPGIALASVPEGAAFPHRIWAACDFEGRTPDYGWFGPAETNRIPRYPGNRTALGVGERPYQKVSAVMTGINPVPGPRMGKENWLYLRYFIKGTSSATFQHFSLTREDNWHVRVSGLTPGAWAEVAVNFTRDAVRNDGSAEPFGDGERMDDFKLFAGRPEEASRCELFIDDVICFANDPALPPEPESFPRRVIFLAAFDTGPKEKYWPGDFDLVDSPPAGAFWRAARSVPRKGGTGQGQFVSLTIEPPRPVGERTRLRFRYHLTGASAMTVQIFDATVQDNRHVRISDLKQDAWTTRYVDFTRDAHRNDGTANSPFTAGNLVDALFFFVEGNGDKKATLYLDEVVLYDAGERGSGKDE